MLRKPFTLTLTHADMLSTNVLFVFFFSNIKYLSFVLNFAIALLDLQTPFTFRLQSFYEFSATLFIITS